MSRLKNTKKLFFDKYLYKVSVWSALSEQFRGKSIDHTEASLRQILNEMEYKGETSRLVGNQWYSKTVTVQDVRLTLALAILASGVDDYHFRVEGNTLSFYVNDETALGTVCDLFDNTGKIREVCRPENDKIKDFLLANPKQIIRAEYSHKYKVTVNALRDADSFKQWAEKLPKLKVMPKNNYTVGGYFYVADLKTLSLCQIFLGDRICRVDELRSFSEI